MIVRPPAVREERRQLVGLLRADLLDQNAAHALAQLLDRLACHVGEHERLVVDLLVVLGLPLDRAHERRGGVLAELWVERAEHG